MAVIKLISELFMMVLCILAGPVGEDGQGKAILIDLVGERGYIDTMIIKSTEEGFAVYDEMDGKLEKFATIHPVAGKKDVYICTYVKGESETVDLPKSIVNFGSIDLRKIKKKTLKLNNGFRIRIYRSADIVYLTPGGEKHTYVVHQEKK